MGPVAQGPPPRGCRLVLFWPAGAGLACDGRGAATTIPGGADSHRPDGTSLCVCAGAWTGDTSRGHPSVGGIVPTNRASSRRFYYEHALLAVSARREVSPVQ